MFSIFPQIQIPHFFFTFFVRACNLMLICMFCVYLQFGSCRLQRQLDWCVCVWGPCGCLVEVWISEKIILRFNLCPAKLHIYVLLCARSPPPPPPSSSLEKSTGACVEVSRNIAWEITVETLYNKASGTNKITSEEPWIKRTGKYKESVFVCRGDVLVTVIIRI